MKKRLAIYARVSTSDKGQTCENQLMELREWAKASGYEVIQEYVEHESGRKAASERPAFQRMFEDAGKCKFNLLLVWALDRLTREGMAQTVYYLDKLSKLGVGFHSYQEPSLSTQDELSRDILLAVLAALAKAEAQRISNRTKAGLERVKAQGKRLGRPPLNEVVKSRIFEQKIQGKSMRAIAKELGTSYSSVRRVLKK